MAEVSQWNRPKKSGAGVEKTVQKGSWFARHSVLSGAIGGSLVVACAFGVGYGMLGSGSGESAGGVVKEKKRGKIAEAKPNIPKPKPQAEKKPERDPSIISIKKTINPFTGEEMWFTNRHHQVKENAGIIGKDFPNNKFRPKRKLFKHYSENYICALMRTPAGMPIVRGRLPRNFDEDFAKSYSEEIKFEEGDTQEDIALKQAMIDFKEEVKEQVAAGESVAQMVLEAREEQNKLADYRKSLMKILGDLRREGATREEIEETREAANVMLEKKGIKQIPQDLPRKDDL